MSGRELETGAGDGADVRQAAPGEDDVYAARARVVAGRLGMRDVTAERLEGGNQNVVIRVVGDGRDLFVRFPRVTDEAGAAAFDVEAWAVRAAAGAGVQTSSIVDRGWADGTAYIVFEHLPGTAAAPDDLGAWRAIGAWIRALRDVDVSSAPDVMFSRFGRDLDRAWAAHVDYNIAEMARDDDPLLALGVYRPADLPALRAALVSLASRRFAHGLVHGDLSTRNVLASQRGSVLGDAVNGGAVIDDAATDDDVTDHPPTDHAVIDDTVVDDAATSDAATDNAATDDVQTDEDVIGDPPTDHTVIDYTAIDYAVIDWGAAGTGPVPWTDLSRLHRWNRMRDPLSPVSDAALAAAVGEALSGSGISAVEAVTVLDELALLSSLDLVRWAIDRRPDRLDEVRRESSALIRFLLRQSRS